MNLATAVALSSLSLYLIYGLCTAVYNLYFHPLARFPGSAFRSAFHFPDAWSLLRGTAFQDIKQLHDEHGSIVRIRPNTVSFTSAQAWKDIYSLKADRTELAKDPSFYQIDDHPANIVGADQTDHARFRKLLAHAFSDTALLEQEPLLTHYFDLLIQQLKKKVDGVANGRVDIMAYYTFTTFDIIGDLILGDSFGALESGEYHTWIRLIFEGVKFLGVIRFAATYPVVAFFLKLFRKLVPSLAAKHAAYMDFTETRIEQRLDRMTDRKDIMSYVLRHNDERGLTRQEFIGNGRVLLVAGSETTATLLSGATYLLLRHPPVLRRAQEEVRNAFQSADDITLRSVSQPDRLPYLDAVLQEALRCYPPIPAALPRVTGAEGAMIDRIYIPANVSVGVHQWSAYHDAGHFTSPKEFVPERWLSDPPAQYRNDEKAALQPFSLGPRVCLGKSLAYFEMRSILARVLWHFDMHLEEASQGWMQQKEHTLWDKPPLWVRLEHRKAHRA